MIYIATFAFLARVEHIAIMPRNLPACNARLENLAETRNLPAKHVQLERLLIIVLNIVQPTASPHQVLHTF